VARNGKTETCVSILSVKLQIFVFLESQFLVLLTEVVWFIEIALEIRTIFQRQMNIIMPSFYLIYINCLVSSVVGRKVL